MDTKHPTPETSAPPAAADPVNPATRTNPPTKEERLALIHSLQCQALQRKDPLIANLEVINGDLMMLEQGMLENMKATLAAPSVSNRRAEQLRREQELFLRFVRQIDRFAQITRQPAPKPKGPAS